MGKEISYCCSCGHRLLVNESEQNRLFVHEGRRYCDMCRPADATPEPPAAVPARRQSSTRLRQQPPAPRPRETTRIRKRSPLPLVLSAAGLLALGIGIAIAAGHSPPAPPGPASVAAAPAAEPSVPPLAAAPAPSIDETLAQVKEMRQSDLLFERRSEIVRMLKELAARPGSRLEEVDQVAAEYDRKFEEAAARLADFTRTEALRMASKQKFTEAIDRLDGYPETFRASKSAETLRLLRQDFERRRAAAAVPAPAPGQPPRRVL